MAADADRVRRAIEEARRRGNEEDATALEGYLSAIESETGGLGTDYALSGPALSNQQRANRIAQYQAEREEITVDPNRNRGGSYWGGMGPAQLEAQSERFVATDGGRRPIMETITTPEGEEVEVPVQEEREVPQPLIDPYSRTGQTLTQFDVGIQRMFQNHFQRKDDAIAARDALYDSIVQQIPEEQRDRMEEPRYWGWTYDHYRNMPWLDFTGYITRETDLTRDDIKEMIGGEQAWMDLASGEDDAQSTAGMFYRFVIQPMLTDDEGVRPSEQLAQNIEQTQQNWLTDETRESIAKPWTAEDATWYKPWSWFDETTKAPWEDWDGFYYSVAETVPNLLTTFVAARLGGSAGATAGNLKKFDNLQDAATATNRLAGLGGAAGAGTAEYMLIRDATYAETNRRVMEIDDEHWENYEPYLDLIEQGMSPTEAKQIVAFETALKAGDTAGVIAGLMLGSPMGYWFGQRAAGRITQEGLFTSILKGMAGEGLQESAQGTTEQLVGNINLRRIDPTQDITEGLLEAGVGEGLAAMGPGGVFGAMSRGGTPGGVFEEESTREAYESVQAIKDAIEARHSAQRAISERDRVSEDQQSDVRIEDFQNLEQLQYAEAQAILENAPLLRDFEENQPGNIDLRMLNALETQANATLTDIENARRERTTAAQLLREEQEIQAERERIQERVGENLANAQNLQETVDAITAVQENQMLESDQYDMLRREGYGRWVGPNQDRFVILPKGVRAQRAMNQEIRSLDRQIETGFTDQDRRMRGNRQRREVIDTLTPERREAVLYGDPLTEAKNRRAFNERVENIDETDPNKRTGPKVQAMAAVDVDGLGWVNDNMTHSAGDRMLMAVSDAIKSRGLDLYRLGGDEFVAVGDNDQQLDAALREARAEIEQMEIRGENESIAPTFSYGIGNNYQAADNAAIEQKNLRRRRGMIAERKGDKPPSYKRADDKQLPLFQQDQQRFEKGKLPWKTGGKEGDFYIRRHGNAAGTPVTERQSVNDIAVTVDKDVLVPEYMRYVVEFLKPQLQARLRGTAQQFITQKDVNEELTNFFIQQSRRRQRDSLPSNFRAIKGQVQRGDSVEVLAPDGAEIGVVTQVMNRGNKSRMKVLVGNREYTFNPNRNWLIPQAEQSFDDIAYITGDPTYSQADVMPQTIDDVMIGHIGRNGEWYADLAADVYFPEDSYGFEDQYPEWGDVPFIAAKDFPDATMQQEVAAEIHKAEVTRQFRNLPNITMVKTIAELEQIAPETVNEVRSMRGASLRGIRGWFDENRPDLGIIILVPNIPGKPGTVQFEQNVKETILHELIGHYGVRGVFGNDPDLRTAMLDIYNDKKFLGIRKRTESKVMRQPFHTDEDYAQLVGEEMVAYMAGEVLAGKLKIDKDKRSTFRKLMDWIKDWLRQIGWMRSHVTGNDEMRFWNDERIVNLIARSQDFVRQGKNFEYRYRDGRSVMMIRDGEIFQAGLISAMFDMKETLSKRRRKELANRYGGLENVPKEVNVFPDQGKVGTFVEAINKAKQEGRISKMEAELSYLDPKGEWYLFRDATYDQLAEWEMKSQSDRYWYRRVLPPKLRQELDTLYAVMEPGPMPLGSEIGDQRQREIVETQNNAHDRIAEIMQQKLDPKNTTITQELLHNYMKSQAVVRVVADRDGHTPDMNHVDVVMRLFGGQKNPNDLTDEEVIMVQDYQAANNNKGWDVGYDPQFKHWWEDDKRTHDHAGLMPQGSITDDGAYRVIELIQSGGGLPVGSSGHFRHRDGVIAHIRLGEGNVVQVKGGPEIPESPNPKMQGKMNIIGEVQSDWIARARQSYRTQDQVNRARRDQTQARTELNRASRAMVNHFRATVTNHIKDLLRPVANLPGGSLAQELEQRITEKYGAEATEAERTIAYKELKDEKIGDVILKLDEVVAAVNARTTMTDALFEVPGAFDARTYELLDRYAVNRLAIAIYDSFANASIDLSKALDVDNQVDLVTNLSFFRSDGDREAAFGRQIGDYVRSDMNESNPAIRLPVAKSEMRKLLTDVYGALGVPETAVDDTIDAGASVEVSTFRVPADQYDALLEAMGEVPMNSGEQLLNYMLGEGALLEAGISPMELKVTVKANPSGTSYDLELSGTKAGIDKFRSQYGNMMRTWLEDNAKQLFRANINRESQSDQKPTNQDTNVAQPNNELIEVEDLERWLDWEQDDDVNSEGGELTARYGVSTFYEFEEELIGDELDAIVEDRTEDWEEIYNSDGEGLWPGSEAFRERVEFDDDGDAYTGDAQSWLREEREEYKRELYDDDGVREEAYENISNKWYEDPAFIHTADLPVAWDEDGDATEWVQLAIVQDAHEASVDVWIDDDQVDTGNPSYRSAMRYAIDEIRTYYEENEINPPAGELFNRQAETEQPELLDPATLPALAEPTPQEELDLGENMPDFTPMIANVIGGIAETDMGVLSSDGLFKTLVDLAKKEMRTAVQTPFAEDKYWRTMVTRYVIADTVRKGMSSFGWHSGMATLTRGGGNAGSGGVKSVKAISWSIETLDIQGKKQEVYVIRAPELSKPFVLGKQTAVAGLGTDTIAAIEAKRRGETLPGQVTEQKPPDPDDYTESQIGDYIFVIRRETGETVGNARATDDVGLNEVYQEDIDRRTRRMEREGLMPGQRELPDVPTQTLIGDNEQIAAGTLTDQELGHPIQLILGSTNDGYSLYKDYPMLGGSRLSYEQITRRIIEQEIKKYGGKVESQYISVRSPTKARKEGGRVVQAARPFVVERDLGSVDIAELTGGYGYVVMSEKKGPLSSESFGTRREAERFLEGYLETNYAMSGEAVEVFSVQITDAMRDAYSGPVPPFHYDPEQDPAFRSGSEKIGYERTSLWDRLRSWKGLFKDHFEQGTFDRFYGLKRAVRLTGQDLPAEQDPYIQARLTTSLDSQMKAVMEYGHPVWKEGMMQTEGKGLLEILAPIAKEIDLWGKYMAGRRAKRLLMEGYSALEPAERANIDQAAANFEGDTKEDRAFNLLVHYAAAEAMPKINRREVLKMMGLGAVASAAAGLPSGTAVDNAAMTMIRSALKGRAKKDMGRMLPPKTRWKNPEQAMYALRQRLMREQGATNADAQQALERAINAAVEEQQALDAARRAQEKMGRMKNKGPDAQRQIDKAKPYADKLIELGREKNFQPDEINSFVELGNKYEAFERVAEDYAAFNSKVLDFAQEAGLINPDTRAMWENADYVPFYRVQDERITGGMSNMNGISDVGKPVKRLEGGMANVGDIAHNIVMNLTKLIEGSMKNNAALFAVDALTPTGIVKKTPLGYSKALIPATELKRKLADAGIDPKTVPDDAFDGFQQMFAMGAPSGPGIISVLRNGKREYYETDDPLLYRAMTNINKKQWGQWMNIFRAPKRLLTTLVTIDPGFMIANYLRDSLSAFVISRDKYVPVLGGITGFGKALAKDEDMRTMLSAGAAFEKGYINQYDPKATTKLIKKVGKRNLFQRTVIDNIDKIAEAYLAIGTAAENANRMAVYQAARRAGKSKVQAAYEAKDLMDFSMHGDWTAVQFLVQTVPFMGARMQGLHRLGRGFVENPVGFAMKGALVAMAGMALWLMFRDDERYKELEDWDKDTYFHFWIGEQHYRLPKPFEVGAIFNTIPERIMEYYYSQENDAGRHLMRRMGFMFTETFAMSPIPQTFQPMMESYFNYNFFTGRQIVSPFMEMSRLPPEQYRYYTSPTMIEMARFLPDEIDTASTKIRSPLHLQNFIQGYTGTIGRYLLQVSDWATRTVMDYPLPPEMRPRDWPVYGRFVRGDNPAATRYQEEFYRLMDRTNMVTGSLRFLEQVEGPEFVERLNEINERRDRGEVATEADYPPFRFQLLREDYEDYVVIADSLESIRESVRDINSVQQQIYLDENKSQEQKRIEIDDLEAQKQQLFREAWGMRPGGQAHPNRPATEQDVQGMIQNWGIDDSEAYLRRMEEDAPETYELLQMIEESMNKRQLEVLARQARNE